MRAVESGAQFYRKTNPLRDGTGYAAAVARADRARNGYVRLRVADPAGAQWYAFASSGTLNLKNAEFARQKSIEQDCACPACQDIRAVTSVILSKLKKFLGLRLITLHNLHFYLNLMRHARAAIENGTFNEFRFNFVANYKGREVDLTLS